MKIFNHGIIEHCNFHVKNTRNDSDTLCVSKSVLTIIITFIIIMKAHKPIIFYAPRKLYESSAEREKRFAFNYSKGGCAILLLVYFVIYTTTELHTILIARCQ